MFFKLLKTLVALGISVALLAVLGWVWFAASMLTMKADNPGEPTDAVIVLTGGKKRIEAGIELLEQGLTTKLFISGVNPDTPLNALLAGKNPPCCIYLGRQAEDTVGNADEARRWVAANNIKSIRLVTSNYHMPRAKLEFDRALPDLTIYKQPVSSDDGDMAKRSFLELTIREYAKLIGAFMRNDQHLPPNPDGFVSAQDMAGNPAPAPTQPPQEQTAE